MKENVIALNPNPVVESESVIIPKARPKKNEGNSEQNMDKTIANPSGSIAVAFIDFIEQTPLY